MATKIGFRSDALEAIHDTVAGMHRAGTADKAKMRHFDEACLSVPPALAPADIKRLRERHRVSQPVFARYPDTSEGTVEKWKAGIKKPGGLALKLPAVVQKYGLEVLA